MSLKTAGGLIIPGSVASVKPPKFLCTICKTPFNAEEGRAYQRHVSRCVKEHGDRLRASSQRVKAPGLFGDEAGDPEYEAHVRRTGRT